MMFNFHPVFTCKILSVYQREVDTNSWTHNCHNIRYMKTQSSQVSFQPFKTFKSHALSNIDENKRLEDMITLGMPKHKKTKTVVSYTKCEETFRIKKKTPVYNVIFWHARLDIFTLFSHQSKYCILLQLQKKVFTNSLYVIEVIKVLAAISLITGWKKKGFTRTHCRKAVNHDAHSQHINLFCRIITRHCHK